MSDLDTEEVVILFKDKFVVTIDANSIWMAIRMEQSNIGFNDYHALVYKRYRLHGQESVLGLVSIGPSVGSTLLSPELDTISGYFSPSPTYTLRFIGVGFPFVAIYASKEDSKYKSLDSVTEKVTSAVSNAVISIAKSWWLPEQENDIFQQVKESPIRLSPLFVLEDQNRRVFKVSSSPLPPASHADTFNEVYAALADTLGRVLLFDPSDGTIIRMWKGWRDAQFGWIQLVDLQGRLHLLLVLYTPRGVLEIYSIPYGSRIAVASVGRDLELIQTPSGILGGVYWKGQTFLTKCFLIDQSGSINEITVDVESISITKVETFSHLKQLLQQYSEGKEVIGSIKDTLIKFQTETVQIKALELFDNNVPLDIYQDLLNNLNDPQRLEYLLDRKLDSIEKPQIAKEQHFLKQYQLFKSITVEITDTTMVDWVQALPYITVNEKQLDVDGIFEKNPDYLNFIRGFSIHQKWLSSNSSVTHPFCLSEKLSTQIKLQISKFVLMPIIKFGESLTFIESLKLSSKSLLTIVFSFIDGVELASLPPHCIHRLTATFYELIIKYTDLIPSIKSYIGNCGIPNNVCFCLNILHQYYNGLDELDANDYLKDLKQSVPNCASLYKMFKGTIPIITAKYNKSESHSIEYLIAKYIWSIRNNDIDQLEQRTNELQVFQEASQIILGHISLDKIRFYLLDWNLKNWIEDSNVDSLKAIESLLSCIQATDFQTCICAYLQIRLIQKPLMKILAMLDQLHGVPKNPVSIRFCQMTVTTITAFLSTSILILEPICQSNWPIDVPHLVSELFGERDIDYYNESLSELMYYLPVPLSYSSSNLLEYKTLVHVIHQTFLHNVPMVHPYRLFSPITVFQNIFAPVIRTELTETYYIISLIW
ncbi:Rab3 GTPase-activating protein regulatory subunit N-terminus-domain-containing protein [Globomyces pollinis-pini]|nr:Rab3 GTPase-activating protein regulatory subunit N-terminus-domain-containing protein [Globomyces pollinis-pini]